MPPLQYDDAPNLRIAGGVKGRENKRQLQSARCVGPLNYGRELRGRTTVTGSYCKGNLLRTRILGNGTDIVGQNGIIGLGTVARSGVRTAPPS